MKPQYIWRETHENLLKKEVSDGRKQSSKKTRRLTLDKPQTKDSLDFFRFPFVGRKLFPLWVGKKYEGVEIAQTVEGIYRLA